MKNFHDFIVELAFFIPLGITAVLLLLFVIHAFRKKKQYVVDGEQYNRTNIFDDFFPSQRRIQYSSEPLTESGIHRKLNYQYVIERMTRKLFFIFILIILFTLSFAYVLYNTSLSEQISPETHVMDEYEKMITRIMLVEDSLEQTQLVPILDLSTRKEISDSTKNRLITNIVETTVKNEDELILSVSRTFFNIYYTRYVLVRILIALVNIGLIRYLIGLYFRIQNERLDLIRKEEALSTMFYVIEAMEDKVDESGQIIPGKYSELKGKMPEFPLHKLFESSPMNTKSKDTNNEKFDGVMSKMNSILKMQKEFYEGVIDKFSIK